MADNVMLLGYAPLPNYRWSANLEIGGIETAPIAWELDPTLPVLFQDPRVPNRDYVVVPKGRIIGAVPTTLTRQDGKTLITVANGVDPKNAPTFATGSFPIGYNSFQLYRSFYGMPADMPLIARQRTIELPYTAINEAYCTDTNGGTHLVVGDRVMAYYGSADTAIPLYRDRGKPVRFVDRKTYIKTISPGSKEVALTDAPFPAFKPDYLCAFGASGLVTEVPAIAYDEDNGRWKMTFTTNDVTSVIYEYGAADTQCVGFISGVEPVGTAGGLNASSHDLQGWLKWIIDQRDWSDFGPMLTPANATVVTEEVVTITDGLGKLAHAPIFSTRAITVKVSGTLTLANGETQTLTLEALAPLASPQTGVGDYTQGQYYSINMLTGDIQFTSDLTVTTCKVSYSYVTDYRNGMAFDQGIMGLTDGAQSGIKGLPVHLDVAGVLGVMRIEIG